MKKKKQNSINNNNIIIIIYLKILIKNLTKILSLIFKYVFNFNNSKMFKFR